MRTLVYHETQNACLDLFATVRVLLQFAAIHYPESVQKNLENIRNTDDLTTA